MRSCSRSASIAAAAVLMVPFAAACSSNQAAAKRRQQPAPRGAPQQATAPGSWIPGFVADMTVQEKVGQLFVPTFSSPAAAKDMIKRYRVGGLIYFPGNTRTPEQTARLSNSLQKTSKVPLLIGVDEEQGLVSRLPYITRMPGNMALGATRNAADVRAASRVTGAELRAVGINQDYAPVADVNVNPANPVIGIRSFGSDPALVARLLGPAIDGYRDSGVAATAKHFPGHGDTGTDSHTGLPVIRHSPATWERVDAPPFRAAVRHNVDTIMSAHIVMPGLDPSGDPATLSKKILTGLLRQKLGYQGVVITDSLLMAGARRKYGDSVVPVRAVNAGADQLLMPPSLPKAYNAVLAAVRRGTISRARLDEAVTRILRLKERRGLFGDVQVDPAKAAKVVGSAQHRTVARQVAEHSITLVRNDGKLLPLRNKSVYVSGRKSSALTAALRRQGLRIAASPAKADVVVLTTLDARTATASRVAAFGAKPVVVAALGAPYDLGYAGRARAALATYSSSGVSITALAKVLTGAVNPSGKLPVKIRDRSYGYGLRY